MKYFDQYVSNTCAGSGNQLYFDLLAGETRTGRAFYKITAGGCFEYSLLFSNIMDSTFSDGSVSHKNLILPEWTILSARVGRCAHIPFKPLGELTLCDGDAACDLRVDHWQPLTFDGSTQKHVAPGEFFASDAVSLRFEAGEFLCLELTYRGTRLPYHEESLLPIFSLQGDTWTYDRRMPLPGQIGCRRAVKARVNFLGDSITQGIGAPANSYRHWNALLAQQLGNDYAFWNLGLGFGRASDAASDGAWLYKAKHGDLTVVCYGVNDIQKGASAQDVERDLTAIVRTLRQSGQHIVLQTIPPFNYTEERIGIFSRVNDFIRTTLAQEVDLVFDVVPVLCLDASQPHMARYGGHPNEEGGALWANALCEALAPLSDRLYS